MRRTAIFAITTVSLMVAGCATTGAAHDPRWDCEAGGAWACGTWGDELLARGDARQAEVAYERACAGGVMRSCIAQGRLLMERGELEAADLPLRKAYLSEDSEGYEALADLYEAKAEREVAGRLRREALAIDKPDAEFVTSFRASSPDGVGTVGMGTAVTLNVQPMFLFERRLSLGMHLALPLSSGRGELDGFIGYQHFMSTWLVGYGRLLVGSYVGEEPGQRLNLGAEMGVKLCWGPVGHVEVAMGTSSASPVHVSVGLGLNAIFLLIAALR